jgi:hypothetical protein
MSTPATTEQTKEQPLWLIILVVFFIGGIGSLFGIVAYKDYKFQEIAHNSFVAVPAKIISSKIKVGSTTHNGTSRATYEPLINYEYEAGEQTLKSSRYRFDYGDTYSEKKAQRVIDRYPAGVKTQAYYNPQRPQMVVLDNSAPELPMTIIAFLIAFYSILLLILMAAIIQDRKKKNRRR